MRKLVISICLCLTACADYPITCEPAKLYGLSEKELIKLCGKPAKINHYGREQWVYKGRYDLYVYVVGGHVDNVQWSEYR